MARRTVLLINKFYHDVGPAGGVGRYILQEEEDLSARGWSVVPFAMKDADARPSQWDRFFVVDGRLALPIGERAARLFQNHLQRRNVPQ